MIDLKVSDFYKRGDYGSTWKFLLGVFVCTFMILPVGLIMIAIDRMLGGK